MNTKKNLSHFYAFTNWKHSSSGRQILKPEKKSFYPQAFVAFKQDFLIVKRSNTWVSDTKGVKCEMLGIFSSNIYLSKVLPFLLIQLFVFVKNYFSKEDALEIYTSTLIKFQTFNLIQSTVFENHRNSLIQHCERSELCLHISGQKLNKNAKNTKNGQFCDFLFAAKQSYQIS